ncbi:hypothetical protein HaLaN_18966, partial [Haematococcus lacustris]
MFRMAKKRRTVPRPVPEDLPAKGTPHTTAGNPRVEAISERAVLASLLLGLLVRGLFTIHVADPLGLHDQPLETAFSNMLTLLFARRLKKSVSLAGTKVLLGTNEHQRRFGFRGLGGGHLPAWSKRQCTYVRRMVCGLDVSWLLIKQAKQRWPDRILALAYGAVGFSGSGSIGCRGVPVPESRWQGRIKVGKVAAASVQRGEAFPSPGLDVLNKQQHQVL